MFPLLILLALFSAALPRPAEGGPMELSFGRVAARAGEQAALPIYLVSDTNVQDPFQITLEYSTGQLSFTKIEADYLAQKANWAMKATVRDHPEKKDRRVVQIDITPGEAKFFPSGGIAHVHFLVSKDQGDDDITLDAALIAPGSSKPVPPNAPAKIIVYTTPIFGCFFYMH